MKKIIDYYIYIDYSENLVGYNIIEKKNIPLIWPKVIKFRHYKEERHKRTYLIKIRREIKNLDLDSLILKQKIKPLKDNLLVFADVIEFVKEHDNCVIFASAQKSEIFGVPEISDFCDVDNNQFNAFTRLLNIIPHKDHITIVKESELKKESVEYRLSLIIDTKLNLERTSK